MGKDKIARFKENQTFNCLHQPNFDEVFRKDWRYKGLWNTAVFAQQAPIGLELGCGKGEYTLALARLYPNRNYIGIDIKGARLWRGAKTATTEQLHNVAFIRTRIDFIESIFAPNEVDEIWITFPDPQIHKERKRLTHPLFLDRYAQFLRPGGTIHLKTDSQELHNYTLELAQTLHYPILHASSDILGTRLDELIPVLKVHTFYEKQYLTINKPITYLSFQLSPLN
ncbi:MAG: tRNA (guanosine(46)-N7)-methyltransferase TrmB [Prevotellaceae bacterium]|jgi:tRNA (guanine-N7-)-methyltransferase|nr:tRNA (guanosine(46)-N7)-methyltransferase TrmB [Prevotellaceae bacterium]